MEPKRILLTGARSYITLDLSRKLSAGGHTVFVADSDKYHVCRFSKKVKKSFVTPSPRFHPDAFIACLKEIIIKEKIDLVIPTCEEILYISKGIDELPCQVFCEPFAKIHDLHSKWHFTLLEKRLGISIPDTTLIRTPEDLKKLDPTKSYALKSCYSRASQNMVKISPGRPIPPHEISPYNPSIAQVWLEGTKYCTYTIAHKGKIHAHATYPVDFTVDGNSCITFRSIKHAQVQAWVENIVAKLEFTGQISFDLFETNDGMIYAIECNPRATSGVHLFEDHDSLDLAFFGKNDECIKPGDALRKQIAMGMLMYGWKNWNKKEGLPPFWKQFFKSRDIVWSKHDKRPFALIPLLFPYYILKSLRLRVSLPAAFTHDFDWNGSLDNNPTKWDTVVI